MSTIGNAYAQVPEWVKNTAGWWSEGLIEDKDFLKGIEYLLNEEIIKISKVSANAEQSDKIP
ncbi:MAG: peptidase, partial [Nitrosopumilaceae archaeon]|nr:peptidase [Nitrosopumilaceae archaeon]